MRVLIVCVENWDTLSEIPYVLKKAGCTVDVLCSKDSWLLSNSFYDQWIERKPCLKQYIGQVEELAKENLYDWILLGDDVIIKQVNESALSEELLKHVLPISELEHRSILSSKIGLSDFCLANGIASPQYLLYNNANDLNNIQANIKYPVINKIDFSWGGANMFVSNDFDALESNLHLLPRNKNTMIQEYIIGEEVPVEAIFLKGELLEYMTSKILQFDKGPFSLSTKRSYYDNPDLKPLLQELGKKLGITGFANIAYIKEASTGIYYLIEIDLRPNSWMAYGRFCQKDFSKALKKHINGNTVALNRHRPQIEPIEIALFYKDMRRSFWQRDLKGVIKWILNYKSYWRFIPYYDWHVLKRILGELGKIIFHKLDKISSETQLSPQNTCITKS